MYWPRFSRVSPSAFKVAMLPSQCYSETVIKVGLVGLSPISAQSMRWLHLGNEKWSQKSFFISWLYVLRCPCETGWLAFGSEPCYSNFSQWKLYITSRMLAILICQDQSLSELWTVRITEAQVKLHWFQADFGSLSSREVLILCPLCCFYDSPTRRARLVDEQVQITEAWVCGMYFKGSNLSFEVCKAGGGIHFMYGARRWNSKKKMLWLLSCTSPGLHARLQAEYTGSCWKHDESYYSK